MTATLRKTLALLLCLCMCLSLVPAAFAEEGAFGEEEAFSFEEPAFGEEPAFEEPAEEEPAEEPAFAEEPFTEEPAEEEEPFAEEPAFSEEPAEEQPIEEEPAEETPAEEPIVEEPVEEPTEEPAAEAEPEEQPAFEAEEGEDFDASASGSWGSLSWSLDSSGKLTITGSGPMNDFNYYSSSAWRAYKTDIKSVVIGSGVTSIGDWAFYDCSSLTSVTIPNSVTYIGVDAFAYCSSLTSVTIPDSVTSIGNYAFSGCRSLTGVTIPNSVTSIGWGAFYNCSSLTSVTIPNSVTSIGDWAFAYCGSLTSVTIPNSVTSIGYAAFSYCRSLTSIQVSEQNANYCSVDGVLFDKSMETLIQYPAGKSGSSYTVPNSVTSIGYAAFSSCSSLTSVTIPNSVTSIDEAAFWFCTSLTSVTIPNSVTSIGSSAFYGCSSLTSVTIPNSVTTIGDWAFLSCSSLRDVYFIGTQAEWDAIRIGSDNDPLTSATLHLIPQNLPTPTLVSATASGSSIVFRWTAVPGAAKYRVYRKYAGVNWTAVANVTDTSYTDSNVTAGTVYTYTVRCLNAAGQTVSGFDANGKSAYIALPTPTLVSATASGSSIVFKWSAVGGAAKYRVYRKYAGVNWTAVANVAGTSYTDTNVTKGTVYTYTVRCVTSDGKTCVSGFNATGKSATVAAAQLATPTLVSAAASGSSIVFRWNAVSGAARYRVYRKYAGVNWTALANVAGTSYTDTNVARGTVYTYTVRCLNAAGQTVSGFDATGKSAFVSLPTPTLVSAAASGSSIVFKWNAVSGSARYRVYRKYGSVNWTAVANVAGTSYTDSNVTRGTVYTYTVRCVTADGKTCVSGFNATGKSAWIGQARFSAPRLHSATASGSTVYVRWYSVPGAEKYRLLRSSGSGNWVTVADIAARSGDNLITYTDINLSNGTYRYTVCCVSADGRTVVSDYDTAGVVATVEAGGGAGEPPPFEM